MADLVDRSVISATGCQVTYDVPVDLPTAPRDRDDVIDDSLHPSVSRAPFTFHLVVLAHVQVAFSCSICIVCDYVTSMGEFRTERISVGMQWHMTVALWHCDTDSEWPLNYSVTVVRHVHYTSRCHCRWPDITPRTYPPVTGHGSDAAGRTPFPVTEKDIVHCVLILQAVMSLGFRPALPLTGGGSDPGVMSRGCYVRQS